MPIQGPQWTEFLTCPICLFEFNRDRGPVSLSCGHTICKTCLQQLHRKRCPFDQSVIGLDLEQLPLNWALLQLVTAGEVSRPQAPPVSLAPHEQQAYLSAIRCIEELALFLKPLPPGGGSGGGGSGAGGPSVLSRSMQRKLVTIVTCQLLEPEGRSRALRACRSLGERTVTELILHHQNPAQLSANLWAAVRARGCQFLGPAMQEEVLRLVLLALEEGYALSRKVLVMFVVQRLEPHFPQASKTSIGHVVQLLYRASCFKVTKREGDSSLMQLKEEFRTYESLRREHDTQIVQIALEAGLRIAPDQWSSLLYGDVAHKSHMQSIMDKLQSPSSFNQSIQELVISLQKTGDPAGLSQTRMRLQTLAAVDPAPDSMEADWEQVVTALEAAAEVVRVLISFVHHHGGRRVHVDTTHAHNAKYKTSLCRDLKQRGTCPRGPACTFAHSEEELERYRAKSRRPKKTDRGAPDSPSPAAAQLTGPPMAPRVTFPLPPGAGYPGVPPQRVVGLVPPPTAVPVPVVHAVARLPYQLEYFTPVCSPGPASVQLVGPAVGHHRAVQPGPPQQPPPGLYGYGAAGVSLPSPPRPGQAITSLSSSGLTSTGGITSSAPSGGRPPAVPVNVNSPSIASKSLTALRQRKQEILHQLEHIVASPDGDDDSQHSQQSQQPEPPVPANAPASAATDQAGLTQPTKHYSIWTSSDSFFHALKSSLAEYQNTKSRATNSGPVYSNVRVSSNEDEYIPFSSTAEEFAFGPISRTERAGTTPSRPVQVSALSGDTVPTEAVLQQPRPVAGHVLPPSFMQICDPFLYNATGGLQYQLVHTDPCGMHYNTIGHGVLDPPGLQMLHLKPSGDRPSDPLPIARNTEGSLLAAENIRFQNELDSLERKFQDGVKLSQVLSGPASSRHDARHDDQSQERSHGEDTARSAASHVEKDLIRELWFIEHGIEEKQKENRLNVRSSNTTSSVSLGPTPLCSTAALPYGAFAAAERAQYPGSRYTPPPHHHQAQHGAGARLYPPSDSPLGAAHMYAADGSGQPASKFGMAPQRPAVSGAMGDGHGGWTFGQEEVNPNTSGWGFNVGEFYASG